MASSYTVNNGIEKPATGEQNGTWGTTANTDFDLIDTALDGVVTLALVGTTHALAITDGAASDGRNRILLCTGALAANNTITLTPNDAEKYFFVYNGTTGGFSVIFAQGGGSGSTVTIANGYWAIVRCDGTGTNANVTRVLDSLEIGGTLKALGLSVTTVSAGDGSAASPGITFTADANTGLYRIGADQIGVSTGGTLRETISTTAVTHTLPQQGADGSAGTPQYGFSGDTNTGIFRGGTDIVGISTGGTERMRVDASGNVGIGGNPSVELDVIRSAADCQGRFYTGSADLRVYAFHAGAGIVGTQSAHPLILAVNGLTEALRIATDGKTGIATNAPTQILTVQGQGVFQDVATTLNPNDSAGDCLRVGVDSGTGRAYVTASDGSASTKSLDIVAASICIPSAVIVGSAAGSTPGPSSAFQINSTTGGLLLPRMTTTQRDALAAADGMIIYNTTTGKFQGYAASAWVDFH